jgi:hypothetical protein
MEKRTKRFSIFGILILFILVFMSAFSLNTVQGQQAEGTPTPIPTISGAEFEAFAAFTPTPLPEIKNYGNTANFSFLNIGQPPLIMRFPSINAFTVAFPNQWYFAYANSDLIIHYDLFEQDDWAFGRPLVEVYIDGFFAGSFSPVVGENQTARIGWPSALAGTRPDNLLNSYTIQFLFLHGGDGGGVSDYDYDAWCDYSGVLSIRNDSEVNLSFTTVGAYRSLQNFPRPLVQDSFIPETLYFILPDDIGDSDLVALSTVASAIGRGTGGALTINVLNASEATPQMLADSNAVIIGKPGSNAFLDQLAGAGVSVSGASGDDGFLQLIPSTVNSANSFLIVSGNSDNGVIKAAQTLSEPLVGLSGTVYIAKAGTQVVSEPAEADRSTITFLDLGFTDTTFYGARLASSDILFYVPRNWELQDGANLVINYSSGTNDLSTDAAMNVSLNDAPIAAAIIDQNLAGEKQLVIPLKKEQILPGSQNVITIDTIISQPLQCTQYNPNTIWMAVRDTSYLHLPYKELSGDANLPPIIHPYFYLVNEPTILFSLPAVPSQTVLNGMANLSFNLGTELVDTQPGIEFLVSRSPDIDCDANSQASAVMFGKPTDNNAIVNLNDALPQPFIAGQNALTPKSFAGRVQTNENVSIGVVQALPAPWNPFKVVTVVTGTSDEGLDWALANASDGEAYGDIVGDIVFVREGVIQAFLSASAVTVPLETVLVDMTDSSQVLEEVEPTSAPVSEVDAEPVTSTDQYVRVEQEVRLTQAGKYAIAGLVGLGLLVAVFAVTRTIRGGRKR